MEASRRPFVTMLRPEVAYRIRAADAARHQMVKLEFAMTIVVNAVDVKDIVRLLRICLFISVVEARRSSPCARGALVHRDYLPRREQRIWRNRVSDIS